MTLFTQHNFAAKADSLVGFKADSIGNRGLLAGESSGMSEWTTPSYCPTHADRADNSAEAIAETGCGQLPRARQIGQALRSL